MLFYLCGAITTDKRCQEWRETLPDLVDAYGGNAQFLNPCRGKDSADWSYNGLEAPDTPYANGGFVLRDLNDIDKCDVVILYWWGDPGRIPWGSAFELGYAKGIGKRVVVIDEDGGALNHPFVECNADRVFTSLKKAAKYLAWVSA